MLVAVGARRAAATGACTLLACLALFALSSDSASALVGHKLLTQLTPSAPGLPFKEPGAVAVDEAAGEVFVADGGTGKISVFNSSGAYITQFADEGLEHHEPKSIAVDEKTKHLYVVSGSGTGDQINVYKPNGSGGYELLSEWSGANTPQKTWGSLEGIAVDNSSGSSAGNVYIVNATEAGPTVDVFKPKPEGSEEAKEGQFVSTLAGTFAEPIGITVDSADGKVLVADKNREVIEVFSPTGVEEKFIKPKGVPGGTAPHNVAVNPSTGELYVVEEKEGGGAMDQLNPAGEWVGSLTGAGTTAFSEVISGVAVTASGDVYIADPESDVAAQFGPNAQVPAVKTGKGVTTKFHRTTANISGSINPEGAKGVAYFFEYGEVGAGFQFKTAVTPIESPTKVTVKAELENLNQGVEYEFRIVGEEDGVTTFGTAGAFAMDDAVEGVTSAPATNVTGTSATLNGTLEPNGFDAHYFFEYTPVIEGKAPQWKTSPAPPGTDAGLATEKVIATTNVTGLEPNTKYEFRLVATNSFGSTTSNEERFTTSGTPAVRNFSSEPNGHTAVTLKGEIDPDELETSYHFEYGETTSYGTNAPIPNGVLPAGSLFKPVSAPLTGLKAGTTYHFRLVATNSAGTVEGPDQEFTTSLIEDESTKEVTDKSATLLAVLNPFNADVKYHFEYGTTPAYGTSVPTSDADLAASGGDKTVEAPISGLTADTTYHFRVVATVEGVTVNGPDRTFTTAHKQAFALPDGRAFEMVSPSNKHGAVIESIPNQRGLIQASADGNAFAYSTIGPVDEEPEGNRTPEPQQSLSARTPDGWGSQELVTPHEGPLGLNSEAPEYQFFSSDLALSLAYPTPFSATFFAEPPLTPPAQPGEHQEKTMYVRADEQVSPAGTAEETIYHQALANGEQLAREHGEAAPRPGFVPLVTAANTPPGTQFGGSPTGTEESPAKVQPGLEFVDASPDMSHAVLRSQHAKLTSDSQGPGLYEWTPGNLPLESKLQLVSILPDGTAIGEHAMLGAPGGSNGNGNNGTIPTFQSFRHAISADGSRVVWSNNEGAGTTESEGLHLYMRDMAKGETVQVDASKNGPIAGRGEAEFELANKADTKLFFLDGRPLTPGGSTGEGLFPTRPLYDLFECEVVEEPGKLGCNLKDLTADPNVHEHAEVQTVVLGANEEATTIYFVATGALAPGATLGGFNLYQLHESGGTWTTTHIATLSAKDFGDWGFTPGGGSSLNNLTARVSSDGKFLAFMSSKSLTGYDNTDAVTGAADQEVFLYDGETKHITCVSCNPSGARPVGVLDQEKAGEGIGLLVDRRLIWQGQTLAGNIPGWTPLDLSGSAYQSRYLSDTGRLFFTSPDDLVPAAGNHEEDVYEYEPAGEGSCTTEGGCVALVSSGTSSRETAFLDASTSGNDVFFLSADRILPQQDTDESFDIYDARVCTSESPCISGETSTPIPPCETLESCRPASPAMPVFSAPASTSVAGTTSTMVLGAKTTVPPKPKAKPLTRAQKLAKALKECRKKKKNKHKRQACERAARKKYGAKSSRAHVKGRHR